MRKLVTILTVLFCLITTAAGSYTAKDFLAETDHTSRKVYSAALVTGIYAGYMRSANLASIPQDNINACIVHTQELERSFGSYDEMVADVLIYMVVKNSELAEESVNQLMTIVILDKEKCYPKQGQEL